MRFLVDAQLPPVLARWLTSLGHEAEHVADCDLLVASDRVIWAYALANGSVIITKDEDFAVRRMMEASGPQVLWIRLGNTTRRALLVWLEPLLPLVLESLSRGEVLVEIT